MIFVDTGYFVALAQSNDALHVRAVAWSAAVKEPLLVSYAVLLETVNLLSRPVDRPKANALLQVVESSPHYEIIQWTKDAFDAGLALHAARPDKEWSLTDCISFVLMRQRGVEAALTHDRHFEQAGFEALLRREPA